eukprot:COSAG02_NODE_24422_length_688_cov_1.706282_1_plen_23_part_01
MDFAAALEMRNPWFGEKASDCNC